MAANPSLETNPALDDWIAFDAEGTVTVRSGKVDIGQRISTAAALLVADELDIEPARVEVVRVETGLSPDEGFTSGSQSMAQTGNAVRLAAATARRQLLERAAGMLEVDIATLEVDDGTIHSRATNRKTNYWELAAGRPFGIAVDPDAPLRPREALRHVGTAATARGMEALVRGRPYFLHDMSLPGMLHARLVRPPHYRARLTAVDEAVAESLAAEGVEVVRDGSFLAVAAVDEYAAVRAAGRLSAAVSWDSGGGLETGDIYEGLRTNDRVSLPVVDGTPVEAPVPPPRPPPADAVATLEARYERPYQMHASLGPSAAVAAFAGGLLTVHTHSQG
ncbi:MAG: molybdopterin-dependent oxidoreductase, partial [Alphaproteobacteria bacterium]|nr:molybdopterin-dependent oxidoreductase [Alphaproteobacteria bacterium]